MRSTRCSAATTATRSGQSTNYGNGLQCATTTRPVQAGEELLSILPGREEIIVEVNVLARNIGFIEVGMRTNVKIATFPFQEFGTVEGEVIEISPMLSLVRIWAWIF